MATAVTGGASEFKNPGWWNEMTEDELESRVCLTLLFARQCVSILDRQKGRQAGSSREADGWWWWVGGGVHCTQESTCSALWECLDISSNSSAWEKKENHLLCFGCSGSELKGWPQFDISKHRSCKYMDGDKLDSAALISLFPICTPS